MLPNTKEVGVVLEPDDIAVVNQVRAFLKEYYEGGKPVEGRDPYFMSPLQSDSFGKLDRDRIQTHDLINQATSAARELRHMYRNRDRVLSILMEENSPDTELYKSLESDLPIFAERVRMFGSLAMAADDNLSQSELHLIVYGAVA